MNFNNNIMNNKNNGVRDRSEDLTKVFDRKYHANHDVNEKVQQQKKDFNEKFFGIRDREEIRKDVLRTNSVSGQVDNLRQKTEGMRNSRFNNKF